ncbi:hypothetical protein QQP08_009142 [Theobroma cacao]|nr:hypothetical protein QQP08_009142 [Theobroma cacao]
MYQSRLYAIDVAISKALRVVVCYDKSLLYRNKALWQHVLVFHSEAKLVIDIAHVETTLSFQEFVHQKVHMET